MIKLRLAQIEVEPGQPAVNGARALAALERARRDGIDLVALPEMAIPGYLVGDAWERHAFLVECERWTERLVEATRGTGVTLVFGTVGVDRAAKGEDGRERRYNAYVVAQDGALVAHPALGLPFGVKTLLPNYREFDETRYFHDTRRLALERGVDWRGLLAPYRLTIRGEELALGVLLCEDSWDDDYAQRPLEALAAHGAALVLNLSSSPYTAGKNEKRNRVFLAKLARLGLPVAYVNCVGVQNNGKNIFTFDGRSTAYEASGVPCAEARAFAEDAVDLGFDPATRRLAPLAGARAEPSPVGVAQTAEALRYGVQKTLALFGVERVVIGASGGIDSGVAAALYGSVLDPERLLLVNMPSRFNSRTTRDLAAELARRLGCYYAVVGIEDAVALTKSQLDGLVLTGGAALPPRTLTLGGLALENVQARDRGSRVLAGLAAAFGGAFTCNANKAETTVGYATLYGDHGGFLAALADLWKHEVYALGRHLNQHASTGPVIPEGMFTVTPSAELSDAQAVDEGKGDPLIYPYHDRLFHSWVQSWRRATPEEALRWYDEGTLAAELGLEGVDLGALFPTAAAFVQDLERWWNLYSGMGAVKRVQSPPLLVVSRRAFGYDHREHLGRPFYSEAYRERKARLLGAAGG